MKKAYAIPFIVLAVFVLLNGTSAFQLNRALALSGIFVLGITLLSGPLAKYVKRMNHVKIARRFLGVSSFALLAAHGLLSFVLFFDSDLSELFDPEGTFYIAVFFALGAIVILLALTATSFNRAMIIMGKNWKRLQNLAYLALALGLIHFFLTEFGRLNLMQGLVYIFLIIVILLRISMSIRK